MMMQIDLRGKRAFIAGIGDDQGFGWAIAKALADCGAEILIGTWTPLMRIFTMSLRNDKLDRTLAGGGLMEIAKVYPLDATFDTEEDIPEEIRNNKRYKEYSNYSIAGVAKEIKKDFGDIDILIHSLANGPEVKNDLLDTSRNGYLAALSSSSYSFVSLLRHFGPIMPEGAATLSLTYMASERAVPGYGGGMSSAKAALESDTRTLAWEAGRRWGIRVNTISAGALGSRAARAIGFIDKMLDYSKANAPLTRDLLSSEVGNTAAFLTSPLASAITGTTTYVDNGMHAMGVAVNSPAFTQEN
jgi:enoyl-[acyl-carrier protein] reductase I